MAVAMPCCLLGQLGILSCAASVKICTLVSWKSSRINFLNVVLRALKRIKVNNQFTKYVMPSQKLCATKTCQEFWYNSTLIELLVDSFSVTAFTKLAVSTPPTRSTSFWAWFNCDSHCNACRNTAKFVISSACGVWGSTNRRSRSFTRSESITYYLKLIAKQKEMFICLLFLVQEVWWQLKGSYLYFNSACLLC